MITKNSIIQPNDYLGINEVFLYVHSVQSRIHEYRSKAVTACLEAPLELLTIRHTAVGSPHLHVANASSTPGDKFYLST